MGSSDLRVEETLSLQPVSIDARTEAALEIGDEILAMMENMAFGMMAETGLLG